MKQNLIEIIANSVNSESKRKEQELKFQERQKVYKAREREK